MTPIAGRALAALLGLAIAVAGGCGDEGGADRAETPSGPEGATLELFALAGPDDPPREAIAALFGERLDDRQRAALGDALQAIEAGTPRILAVESLDGDGQAVADVEVELAEGGLAEYAVHLRRSSDGRWQIVWFAGPGVDWPEHPKERGPGLSTSHEAGSPAS